MAKNKGAAPTLGAPPLNPDGEGDESFVRVASAANATTQGTNAEDVQALLDQIEKLKSALSLSEEKRSDAEKAALAAAEAQGMLMQRDIQEVATGKTVKVKRCSGYKVVGYKDDGREILRPEWKTVELPTFFYKIDMPPVGGFDLRINGDALYHGAVYEVDIDTLRTLKEMVFRLWNHDRSIHGSDENFYRSQEAPTLSARRGGIATVRAG